MDHRVFVNGEIEGFVNNFETQRNDSEVESLFKLTETVGALKYEVSDTHLETIGSELKELLRKVEDLVDSQGPKEV